MATYGDLKSEIATELRRSDLTSEIATAIVDAVEELSSERFDWNVSRDITLSTVASTEFYTNSDWSISTTSAGKTVSTFDEIIHIDGMWVRIGGNDYKVKPRPDSYLQDLSKTSPTTGQPYYYSYYNNQWRFYPVPDQVYSVRMAAHYVLPALSDDADDQPWTNFARTLVKSRAKALIAVHRLHDEALAQRMIRAEQFARDKLDERAAKKASTRTIEPMVF